MQHVSTHAATNNETLSETRNASTHYKNNTVINTYVEKQFF